ncbi:MAG: substrate-binding domain-containing protein [Lachnospiraceae bacterium]|nr:substrate-binding domain-containing protein [Lachnospiraceae bacterium]
MKKQARIEDIAREAGVGKGTVDRVLHNRGYVSEEKRQLVLKAIKKLDYKPNSAARALAKRKQYRIAIIYHNNEREFWSQVESGFDRAEREFGSMGGVTIDRYVLTRLDTQEQLETLNRVVEAGYDGIAIVPYYSEEISSAIDRAVERGIRVITVNNDEKCKRDCYVGQDFYKAGATAGRMASLIAPENSSYLAVLGFPDIMTQLDDRYRGFRDTLRVLRSDLQASEYYLASQDEMQVYRDIEKGLENSDVKLIYVTYGITDIVARVVSDFGLAGKVILIGHDQTESSLRYLKQNVVHVLIGQEPERQGYEAVSRLCKCLLFDEPISEDVFTKIEIIVAENA